MSNDIHSGEDGGNSQNDQGHNKTVTIIVNTRAKEWSEKFITFEQVVALAFPGQSYDSDGTTVEYSRGHGSDKAMHSGDRVEVKDRMVFDVELANRS
jgi:hypothetical protein